MLIELNESPDDICKDYNYKRCENYKDLTTRLSRYVIQTHIMGRNNGRAKNISDKCIVNS